MNPAQLALLSLPVLKQQGFSENPDKLTMAEIQNVLEGFRRYGWKPEHLTGWVMLSKGDAVFFQKKQEIGRHINHLLANLHILEFKLVKLTKLDQGIAATQSDGTTNK